MSSKGCFVHYVSSPQQVTTFLWWKRRHSSPWHQEPDWLIPHYRMHLPMGFLGGPQLSSHTAYQVPCWAFYTCYFMQFPQSAMTQDLLTLSIYMGANQAVESFRDSETVAPPLCSVPDPANHISAFAPTHHHAVCTPRAAFREQQAVCGYKCPPEVCYCFPTPHCPAQRGMTARPSMWGELNLKQTPGPILWADHQISLNSLAVWA